MRVTPTHPRSGPPATAVEAFAAPAAEVLARTIELARVPAPTGAEHERAALIATWWRDEGFADVALDAAGNCWARARTGEGGALVLGAHLDTVFSAEVDHTPTLRDGRLTGPGVGDDTVALAALGPLGRLVAQLEGPRPIWLLATVGEEGLGDLAGARHAVAAPPAELGAFVALEGNYLGRIASVGVGSRRLRVTLEGPGGHAWERSSAPSALHEAARIVHGLAAIPTVPGATSLNVGRLVAGEAINARARQATFELDLRAADEPGLRALEDAARALLDGPVPEGLRVEMTVIGSRPAGRIDAAHPLLGAAREALGSAGLDWREVATSTDANAAHAIGLPALALGVTTGSDEHTPGEWIDTAPIATGLAVLVDTVRRYEAATAPSGRVQP